MINLKPLNDAGFHIMETLVSMLPPDGQKKIAEALTKGCHLRLSLIAGRLPNVVMELIDPAGNVLRIFSSIGEHNEFKNFH